MLNSEGLNQQCKTDFSSLQCYKSQFHKCINLFLLQHAYTIFAILCQLTLLECNTMKHYHPDQNSMLLYFVVQYSFADWVNLSKVQSCCKLSNIAPNPYFINIYCIHVHCISNFDMVSQNKYKMIVQTSPNLVNLKM